MINDTDISKAKILIVDDKGANVLLLQRMLQGAGYSSVFTTQNSTEVLQLHKVNKYDLILLDLQMPLLDGFGVMQELKEIEIGSYLPVLVITAKPDEKLRALKAGAKDFVSKPFELAEVLARVHNMLEVRLLSVETKNLYEQVLAEKKITERLLLNVLPISVVERLKGRKDITSESFTQLIADSLPEVSVLFADVVGFTKFSEGISPEVLVNVLNDIFTRFDKIADHRGLEKIKTIGDCYMAVAGVPYALPNDAERAVEMAFDMLTALEQFNQQKNYKLNIRIGISTGAAVAGVIGKKKFLYDVWGDVVNTASRMQSHGVSGRIQITDSTRKNLSESFHLEIRGLTDAKGIGQIDTWLLSLRD